VHINPLFLIFCFALTFGGLRLYRRETAYLVGSSLMVSALLEVVKALEKANGHIHSNDAIKFVNGSHFVAGALLLGAIASIVFMTLSQKKQQSLEQQGLDK